VKVTAVLAGASVELFANGTPAGSTFAAAGGTIWVGVGIAITAGQQITAKQTTPGDGPSQASNVVTVVPAANPLPSPVFISPVTTAMSAVRLGGLVPGAKVEIKSAGVVVADIPVSETAAWIPILAGANISAGAPLVAQQRTGAGASPAVSSLPVVGISREIQLQQPAVGQPIAACETQIFASGVVPSADLVADNEGAVTTWYSPADAFTAWGAPPFSQGKIKVKQAFPRIGKESVQATAPVGPPVQPPTPLVQSDICPKLQQVQISNLAPGAVVTVYAQTPDPNLAGAVVNTPIGSAGVSGGSETFNLPPGVATTTPSGAPVRLTADQTRCGLTSAKCEPPASFAAPGGPYMIPLVAPTLYDCARLVVLQSCHLGAQVELRSASTGLPLGDAVFVTAPTVIYTPWFALKAGDKVFVRQYGCNADGDSSAEKVFDLPNPVPPPTISKPVRPSAPAVYAENFLRGGRAHLLVNGTLRSSVDTPYSDAWLPAGSPALVEGDKLWIVQTLCDRASPLEGHYSVVTKGHMKLSVAPPGADRGKTTIIKVDAVDADTGVTVSGQVLLDGKVVGSTGAGFPFSPVAGQANPAGVVKSPPQYFDETFTITLKDPPPVTGPLHLNVGPANPIPLRIALATATWTVTLSWAAGQTFTASGANATLMLPKPPGGSGQITVVLATQWNVAGEIYGYTFPPTTINGYMVPSPTVLTWSGAEMTAGWWALPSVAEDGSGYALVTLATQYQGST
jgi:hypothetical protein